ncbi:hypothetical protein PT276_04300 [Orbaceae bacterium ESL0721]|nr:hypothetical protein [Orbaceae bacterium ESL0721]
MRIIIVCCCIFLNGCSVNTLRSYIYDTYLTKNYRSNVIVTICVINDNRCDKNKIYNEYLYVEFQTHGKYSDYFTVSEKLMAGSFTQHSFSKQYDTVANFIKWANGSEQYKKEHPLETTSSWGQLGENSIYRLYIDDNNIPYLAVSGLNKYVLINRENAAIMLNELKYFKILMDQKQQEIDRIFSKINMFKSK